MTPGISFINNLATIASLARDPAAHFDFWRRILATNIIDFLDGTDGFIIEGRNIGDGLGSSARVAGDVNGDGFDDLIVGARTADPDG